MENNTLILIIALVGALVTPITTVIGIFLQYKKDKLLAETDKEKAGAEAERIKSEAKVIDSKLDMDVISSYAQIVNNLRTQVTSLVEAAEKNGRDIAYLNDELVKSNQEKYKLAVLNSELTKEVQELRLEVDTLKKKIKDYKSEEVK